MDDLISRQAAIDAVIEITYDQTALHHGWVDPYYVVKRLEYLPTAEPTLYGYKIEHLAYIATVMEKEGVTAEYAVRTFDDISRILRMLIDEAREMLEKTLDEGGARMEE